MAPMQWLRWYHGTVTDPKWRVVARRSGQTVPVVIAVWAAMLETASEATERGTLDGWLDEVVAAALDLEPEHVGAIREAMHGLTLDGDSLSGWDKRQPQREDNTSSERVRRHRERKRESQGSAPATPPKRDETQCNADETHSNAPEKSREEKSREEENNTPLPPSAPDRSAAAAAQSEYDDDFEAAWSLYPRRPNNPKKRAFKAWKGRLRAGAMIEDLAAGVRRYAAYIQATGREGTEYVMQAATFFGPDDRWAEPHEIQSASPRDAPHRNGSGASAPVTTSATPPEGGRFNFDYE